MQEEIQRRPARAKLSAKKTVERVHVEAEPHADERLEDPLAHSLLRGSHAQELEPIAVGRERYVLGRSLGKGGMGEVFEAQDLLLGRRVALKIVAPPSAESHQEFDQRMVQEARALARIDHPNVVALYDLQRDEHGLVLTMELLEGGSLGDRLEQGPLECRATLELLIDLLAGLEAAHGHGIVHRDIKPSNILFSDEGTPKIVDFGLARDTARASLTNVGAVLGTFEYMAPEQARDAQQADIRSDLFSLAATAYRCLTGESPRMIVASRLPELLRACLVRALEHDPARRFETAAAFRAALCAARDAQTLARGGLAAVEVAQETAARGDREQAIILLQEILERDSDCAEAHQALARVLVQEDALHPALKHLTRLVELRPESSEAYRARARLHLKAERFEAAEDDCTRALGIAPKDGRSHGLQGEILAAQKYLDEALSAFDTALRLCPKDVRLLDLRAAARLESGDAAGAVADLDEALRLEPEAGAELFVHRGRARLRLNDERGAAADFDRALGRDPADTDARWLRARARLDLDDNAGALEDLDVLYEQGLTSAALLCARAEARLGLADYTGAQQAAEEAVRFDPDCVEGHYLLGDALYELGRVGPASEAYLRAEARDPECTEALAGLGLTLRAQDKPREACAALRLAVQIDPDNSFLRFHLGATCLIAEYPDEALRELIQAAELEPENAFDALWVAAAGGGTAHLRCLPACQGFEADLVAFGLGKLDPKTLLLRARAAEPQGSIAKRLCEAHTAIGLFAERERQYQDAQKHFTWAREVGGRGMDEHHWVSDWLRARRG